MSYSFIDFDGLDLILVIVIPRCLAGTRVIIHITCSGNMQCKCIFYSIEYIITTLTAAAVFLELVGFRDLFTYLFIFIDSRGFFFIFLLFDDWSFFYDRVFFISRFLNSRCFFFVLLLLLCLFENDLLFKLF